MSSSSGRRDRLTQPRKHLGVTPGRVIALGALIAVAATAAVFVLDAVSPSGRHPAGLAALAAHRNGRARSSKSRAGSGLRGITQQGSADVPILVYHVINAPPVQTTANPALYVPVDEFASQMRALKASGWHAVTLDQLEAHWTHGTSLGSGKPIVITFENGYASQYVNALPVLKGLGWVGVENLLVTGLTPSEGGLTDVQVRGLVAAGWELDTEGLNHIDLTALDPAELTAQVTTARQTLHTQYGVPVNWFSYPLGDYDPTVIAALQAAGYLGAMTVNPGLASAQQPRFRLPRLVVTAGTSPSQLLTQIAAAQSSAAVPSAYSGTGLA